MYARCNDNDFGPVVKNCRGDFDFTILFENTILSMSPSLLVLLAAMGRIYCLHNRSPLVLARTFQVFKLVGW